MSQEFKEISFRGSRVLVPAVSVENRTVLSLGKWVRMASVHDEAWLDGVGVGDPEAAVTRIKRRLKADVFTFAQKIPDRHPKYSYRMEWDNVAAIPLTTYADWWEKQIPQESRKNVRRSSRRGVVIQMMELDDEFIRGVTEIYNETPIRQGKPFPKYGQHFSAVKQDLSQLLERSRFIGAYYQTELIGFIKLVLVGQVASILSINAKNCHFDKRPTNALLAKAVEIAVDLGMSHLTYGRYSYGNKGASPLTEFKRRNGFIQINLPRYYIPLTLRGRLILRLNLHRGLIGVLPGRLVDALVKARALFFATFPKPAADRRSETEKKESKKLRIEEVALAGKQVTKISNTTGCPNND